jgi:hypothetical protein
MSWTKESLFWMKVPVKVGPIDSSPLVAAVDETHLYSVPVTLSELAGALGTSNPR